MIGTSFALDNDGAEATQGSFVGTSLWDHVTGPEVRQLYRALFQRVRRLQAMSVVPFRCDSTVQKRVMQMRIVPGAEGGLRIECSCSETVDRSPVKLLDSEHPRSEELLRICSWCLKVCVGEDEWVEIDRAANVLQLFDRKLPRLTHGICDPCKATIFSE